MRPPLASLPVFILLAASLPALVAETREVAGLNLTADVLEYTSPRFDMGVVSSRWSDGNRYEANILCELAEGRAKPAGGGYFFYEERDWHGESGARADYNCWGFGLQGGASIGLLPPDRQMGLALVPHLRGGIGFQDLTVHDVPITSGGSTQRYDLSGGTGRVEVAAGLDIRLTVARRLEVVFGWGADYWSAADVVITAGTGGAGVGLVGNHYAFNGTDTYVRFGLGLRL